MITIKVRYTLTSAFVGIAYVNEIRVNARCGTYEINLNCT